MRHFLLAIAILFSTCLKAQVVLPVFPTDLGKYLAENLHYPDSALEHNIKGRVVIRFVVNEDGHVSDCEVRKRLSPECDEEALRVVRNMPAWKPGTRRGKPVKVYYNLPIRFKLY